MSNANKKRTLSFWQKSDHFPPILCRLLAKQGGNNGRAFGAPISNQEIATATGLTEYQIVTLSAQLDWSGIDLPTMRKFLLACRIDFENVAQMKRAIRYMRGEKVDGVVIRPRFSYLRKSPHWKTFYQPLAEKLLSAKAIK